MRSSRLEVLRQIEALDPIRGHQRIMHLSFGYDFSWDSIRALELALYRTYCVPSISALLDRTGEFHRPSATCSRLRVETKGWWTRTAPVRTSSSNGCDTISQLDSCVSCFA